MQLSRIFTVPGQEKPQLSAVSFLKGTFSRHCEIREGSLTALYCLVISLPCSDKVIQYTYTYYPSPDGLQRLPRPDVRDGVAALVGGPGEGAGREGRPLRVPD